MRKILSTSSFKYLWVILPLVAWAATDFVVARSGRAANFFLRYSDISYDNPLQIGLKISGAKHEPGKKLILILGSSIAREGVDEKIVETELGENFQVLNLGFFHGRVVDLWMLSDELLRLKPDLIVYPTMPGETLIEYSYSLTMPFYFNWNIFGLIGPKEVMAHPHDFAISFLSKASFLFRYRDSIASALLRAAKDRLGLEAWNPPGTYHFSEGRERVPDLDTQLSIFGQRYVPGKELMILSTDKLLRKFVESGVGVLLIGLRQHPKFALELERLGLSEAIQWQQSGFARQMEEWAQQFAGVKTMFLDPKTIKREEYADYLHFNSMGRASFSLWLAQTLKQSKFPSLVR